MSPTVATLSACNSVQGATAPLAFTATLGNVESVTYRIHRVVFGSNPTLSANRHRPHLYCVGSGTPPPFSIRVGRDGAYWGRSGAGGPACIVDRGTFWVHSCSSVSERWRLTAGGRHRCTRCGGGMAAVAGRHGHAATNSSHRIVPYTYNAFVTDQTAAQDSTQPIRDVVHAVRSNTPLEGS
jgi:hypothetical protein